MKLTSTNQRAERHLSGLATSLKSCILLPLLLASSFVSAKAPPTSQSVLDRSIFVQGSGGATIISNKDLIKEVKKEQKALAKENKKKLQSRAENGERLAQVVLANDFASEAQLLTFSPAAANAALSDALKWRNLAAKRGFPGAPSLDLSGVSSFPIRVIRNR